MSLSPLPFELTIKDTSNLEQVLPLLQEFKIRHLHLTHINQTTDRLAVVKKLMEQISDVHLTLTFSTKYSSPQAFVKELLAAYELGARKYLIVSGYPLNLFDTCQDI